MEKRAVFGVLIVLLWAVLNVSLAQEETVYFKESGDLTLRPTFSGRITNILWKLKGDLVAEWIEGLVDLQYYGRFVNRTTLDIKTGTLVMKDLTKADEGRFTLELNSKVHPQRYISKAIKEVPTPEVWMQPLACNPDKYSECKLKCEGNTTEAEPATYSWKEDGGKWQEKRMVNIIDITKVDSAHVEKYTCRMENPISLKESDARNNPFFKKPDPPPGPGMAAGIVVGVILVVVAVAGFLGWKFKDSIAELLPKKQDRVHNGNNANNEHNDPASTPLKDAHTGTAENP